MANENVFTSSSNTTRANTKSTMVHEQPKFDLESYVQNYQGRTVLQRLIFIGRNSSILGVDALVLAVNEAKKGRDVKAYLEAQNSLEAVSPNAPAAARDLEWVETMNKKNSAESTRLEDQLKGYKNNLIKESIRMGNQDLGMHYQSIGDLPKAYEAFSRMRLDATQAETIAEVSKHCIEVAIEQEEWIPVSTNVSKIQGVQHTPEEEKAIQPFYKAAGALASLYEHCYANAARQFLAVESGMGSSCSTFISPNDVATYGGLLALASMDRNELQTKVLENSNFRTYLELEPHIRRAITCFVNSRYSACLDILESYKADYLLDIRLSKHVDELYSLIRTKSIVQYFIPFSCVTLDSLNTAFAAPGTTIDKELSKMIARRELLGRIDTQNRLLVSVPVAPRSTLHTDALKTARDYEREARRRIQQVNIVGADLEVRGKARTNNSNTWDEESYSSHGRQLRSQMLF